MHSKLNLLIVLSVFFAACGQRPASAAPEKPGTAAGDLLVNAIRYDGKLIDNEARFLSRSKPNRQADPTPCSFYSTAISRWRRRSCPGAAHQARR
jgi:hypothetical protein